MSELRAGGTHRGGSRLPAYTAPDGN